MIVVFILSAVVGSIGYFTGFFEACLSPTTEVRLTFCSGDVRSR